jgi:hypothetical protein
VKQSGIFATDFDNNRIIRVSDMTGAGWKTYGSSGSGVDHFDGIWDIFVR